MVNITKLRADNPIDVNSSFLLPCLSESLPIMGEKINCIKAKTSINNPNPAAPTPNEEDMNGNRGNIMAYPVASMNTVKSIIDLFKRDEFESIVFNMYP